jgi:alkylation response protein AidB-like acyl-CoA dehydrogenase
LRLGRVEGERIRQLPENIVEALSAGGLFGMGVPHKLGGGEVPLVAHYEVLEALGPAARLCARL